MRAARPLLPLLLGAWILVPAEDPPPVSAPPAVPVRSLCGGRTVEVSRPTVRLVACDGGEGGLPVLFVHGLASDGGVWRDALAHLREGRRAAAFDLRGHGESSRPRDGNYSIAAQAADVGAVADALGLKRFVLVGHSLGAAVVACYAGKNPKRVAGILLVDPAGDVSRLPKKRVATTRSRMEPATYSAFMEGWFSSNMADGRPATREEVFAALHRTDREVVSASYAALARYSPVRALKRYRGPALILGRAGKPGALSLRTLVPSLPVEEVDGVGHWLMLDDPDRFNARLDAFLAGIHEPSSSVLSQKYAE